MNGAYTQKTETRWDQSAFNALKATWSPERIAEDEKYLQEVFSFAAESPLLKEALDWANTHGIRFFVDRTATGAGGYYTLGTGVMALTEKFARAPETAVEGIVHEIRHAWQDYHGFSKNSSWDFSQRLIETSLIEADARVFGKMAVEEYRSAHSQKGDDLPPDTFSPPPHDADRGEKFMAWFAADGDARFYGDQESAFLGTYLDLPGPVRKKKKSPQASFEFAADIVPPPGAGIDIGNVQNILPLGRGFSGTANYLAALQPDILLKKVLRPSLANTFWDAANDDQKKLTTELRKTYLRKKLAHKLPGAEA